MSFTLEELKTMPSDELHFRRHEVVHGVGLAYHVVEDLIEEEESES